MRKSDDVILMMEDSLQSGKNARFEFWADEYPQSEAEKAEDYFIEKGYGVDLTFAYDSYILRVWNMPDFN
ncbi:hypothetical protein K6L05_00155 [Salinicoccus roseus]|uniref:hypothetical protein n=1 Tax=Salinicoccus roseus TaxID=45670 RepID=UPI001CA699A5|nr:hypothetical protein [Salinicoccus roseus]MBY8908197.1 hypothetical protein [Salinicoccus roseus]